MIAFQYHPDILRQFPAVVGGIIVPEGIENGPTPEALWDAYLAEQQATLERIGQTPLRDIESLAAWRQAFRAFGVNPTKYRSAAEALLRRLTKKGDIPSVNALVDLCNLVSIRYAIPIAALDTRVLQGAVTVHFSDGTERFTPLGEGTVEHPEPGEVIFSDETKLVVARRWCWRQSDENAARLDTTRAMITVEAHHAAARSDVEAAVGDILGLMRVYVGGEVSWGILDSGQPALSM